MSWLGQGRCTCPACGQRIYDYDAHERVVTRQVKLVYMCPGCGTYLKQVKDKSFKTVSVMLCLMALFLLIDIGFLIYTQDVCVFSLLSCVLFMCFYYLRFGLVNRLRNAVSPELACTTTVFDDAGGKSAAGCDFT